MTIGPSAIALLDNGGLLIEGPTHFTLLAGRGWRPARRSHVRTWSGGRSALVTDMTNAGKRGKTCPQFHVAEPWLYAGPRGERDVHCHGVGDGSAFLPVAKKQRQHRRRDGS